jgi:hypothetical protein
VAANASRRRALTARSVAGLAAGAVLLSWCVPAVAQNEAALKASLEGRRVTLKIDMPATQEGVDLHPDSREPLNYRQYGDRLRKYGVAITAGESTTVTLVKQKKDLIEFQVGGGGFGTFGDDTSTSVSLPLVEKSSREEELEDRIRDETDPRKRREMERELDHLSEQRERENRRIEVRRAELEEEKRQRIARERLTRGSRFNLRYSGAVPRGIKPDEVMAALAQYVDFGGGASPGDPVAAEDVSALETDDRTPRKGMTMAEALRQFGKPVDSSNRAEGALTITTLVFERSGERIIADFVEDVLVRYSIASK